ncbi:MAG: hypothetical protein MJ146_04920, partial [Clostridia bacterium]|nr:hypothetical protein [Clostridia bacterium]
ALNDEPVATIGSVPYPTLQDAVDAAKTNDVITLNGTCSENVKVTEAKTFTIQGTFNGTVSVDTGLKLTQNDNVYTVTSDNEDKEKTYEKIKAALVKAAKVISIFLDKQIAFVKAIKATAGFSIIRSILGYFMGR